MTRHRHRAAESRLEDLGPSNGNVILRRERCKCGAWRTIDLGRFGKGYPGHKPERVRWETGPEPTGKNVTSPALRAALSRLSREP